MTLASESDSYADRQVWLRKAILWRQIARLSDASTFKLRAYQKWAFLKMQPTAIWIVYTLMFGYPVPTLDSPQFTSETSCQVYLGTLNQQVIEAFKLVCSRDHL